MKSLRKSYFLYLIQQPLLKMRKLPWSMWLSSLEYYPVNQKVVGLIPGQGTCLDCRFGPRSGCV